LPVLKGNYKFEIVIRDLDTNNQAADTIDIEVK
jgi:hypothetical protein